MTELEPSQSTHIASEVLRIACEGNTEIDNLQELATQIELRGLANANIARIRRWKPVPRDEIQKIFDLGRGNSEQETRIEILIRRLMETHGLDRVDAMSAFRDSDGITNKAHEICASIASFQEKSMQEIPILPTRDTRSPPDVTPQTRVLAILGLHEDKLESTNASPSIGDGWMVSDFYLWMHVLNGMGKSQEWSTSLRPKYLVDKQNYDRLKKILASDPHPKRERKRFVDGFVDDSHPDVVAWHYRHPDVVDEDYPDTTAGVRKHPQGNWEQAEHEIPHVEVHAIPKGSADYHESKVVMDRIRIYMKGKMDVAQQARAAHNTHFSAGPEWSSMPLYQGLGTV
ncbi:hypothetical protein SI65_00356 [Aspergillus cristatus]|uniref:Uncharacterized protein n=1 Tax=Aspergillus cristatus TaxID=573508 RepID=A0A1E3BPE9_ASPCR|nr:hypothetical protein SI65_00356 [Aspergillus cristatus]